MKISESLPNAFRSRMESDLGLEFQSFIQSMDKDLPVSIRLNVSKKVDSLAGNRLEDLEKVAWNDHAFYLPIRPNFTFDPKFHAGAYYVQEASSMFLSKIFARIRPELPPNAKILDLCAAPGGKSTLILDEIGDSMLLVSNEVIKSRASILADNLCKWGLPNVVVTNNDPRDFTKLNDFFDVIVVDAPCSGEGMFRKDMKAIGEWSEASVDLCAARQQRIIDDILPALKPGGFLIYSTCTYSEQENRNNLFDFINKYSLKSIKIPLESDLGIVEIYSNDTFSYHFFPHKVKGEGFFVACIQKNENEDRKKELRTSRLDFLSQKQLPMLKSWICDTDLYEFTVWKEQIQAIPKSLKADVSVLLSNLYIIKVGVDIGKIIGNELIPSHELALSLLLNTNLSNVELTLDEALIYLKKGDVSQFSQISNMPNGWALVKFEGLNLGWIKKIGNRTNNYLPKELRILKDL